MVLRTRSSIQRISNAKYKISHSFLIYIIKEFKNTKKWLKNINLKLLGKHNVLNASIYDIALCLNHLVQISI